MSEEKLCPVCQSPIAEGQASCPRCGFKLVGQTEQFHSVDDAGLASSDAHKVDYKGNSEIGTPAFTILKGPMAGEVFKITHFPITIGRDPSCELFLNDRTVTRKHATLDVIGNEVVITDLNSLNGIWIDGEMRDSATLVNGTIVQIGIFTMAFSV